MNGSAASKLGGKFALEIAPLLGLAGKLAAGTTSCCLSKVVTANRASCDLLTFQSCFKLQASTRVFKGPHITYQKSHEEVSHEEVELLW